MISKERALAVSTGLLCVILWSTGSDITISLTTPLWHRLVYPFSHTNIFHMLGNLWCLYLVSKPVFRLTIEEWVLGYLIAITAPAMPMDTMGLSGMLYAVIGMVSWRSLDKKKYHTYVLAFMALGLLFPTKVNNLLHIWCYGAGVLIGKLRMHNA